MHRKPLSALARFAVTRPWLSLGLCLGLCLLSALAAVRVEIQTNVASLLPKGTAVLDRFHDLERVFGSSDLLLVAVDGPELPEDDDQRAAVLASRGELTSAIADQIASWTWDPPGPETSEDMVSAVLGSLSESRRQARADHLVANTWLMLDHQADSAGEAAELDAVIQRLTPPKRVTKRMERPSGSVLPDMQDRDPLGLWTHVYVPWWQTKMPSDGALQEQDGFLLTRDQRSHVLVASPVRQSQESAFCDIVVERTEGLKQWLTEQQAVRPEWKDFSIESIGGYFIAHRDFQSATQSALFTMVTSLAGVMVLFALVYRSLSLAALIGTCLIPAIGASLGLASIVLGGELSMIVSGFAAILIGLGADFFIHIYNAYGWALARLLKERELSAEDNGEPLTAPDRRERCQLRGQAALEAISHVGGGLVAAAATSVATFLILLLSHYRGLQELGAICGIGLLLILVQAVLAAPAFLTLAGTMAVKPSKIMDRLAGLILRRPLVCTIFLVALIGGSLGYLGTRDQVFVFDKDPRDLRPAEDPYYEAQQVALKRLGLRSSGHYLLLSSDDPAALVTTAHDLVQRLAPLRDPLTATTANNEALELLPGEPVSIPLAPLPEGTLIDGRRTIHFGDSVLLAHTQDDHLLVDVVPEGNAPVTLPPASELVLGPAVDRLPSQLMMLNPPNDQHANLKRMQVEINWDELLQAVDELPAELREKRAPFIADLKRMHQRIEDQQPLLPDELMATPLGDVIGTLYRREGDTAYLRLEIALARLDSDGLQHLHGVLGMDDTGTGQDGPVTYGSAGPPSIAVSIQELLEADFGRMGLMALSVTTVLIFICLGSLKGSMQALLALFGGLIVTLTSLQLVGQNWNLMNTAVMPLIVGIGIDNGIHFVHALRHTHYGGVAAVRQAFVEVGHPIIMTSLTSIIGFSSLMLNDFRGMQSCGTTAVIGIASCLLVAVIGLPILALLHARIHATRRYPTRRTIRN